jgi:hypothetical protein
VHHHVDRLVRVEVRLPVEAGQTQQRGLCLLELPLSDQQPGTFWRQEYTNGKRSWPHPLQCIGDSIRPLAGSVQHGHDDADSDQLSKAPAEVYVSGQVASHGDGADLRGVSDGEGLENTPWL